MTDSSSKADWMSMVNWLSSDTMTHLKDELQRLWSWQPPCSELPPIHVAPPPPVMVATHIPMRWQKAFRGHRFKVGGSKK